MSKQDEGAIWWAERGYFTATPEQLERLISLGAQKERERIIELLKTWECENDRCYCTFYRAPDRHCKTALDLIALIKGEQK